ncbi:DUF2188 domain-containing protein [Mycoplasmopsis alligatoris]|uniref:DUF2188 domain-containing protein n=1 Tax=Mycoplasmopsis alligatoris A21JP2 TaxID=747682 RepID=D4XW34_9BACT|nr:DUF2188 domain-containing protein [Mycoplasmopsis alligatoris]EFF41442.1 conserved hypothetical protein [Mycoplasmopsis alligatoris A21JP2]
MADVKTVWHITNVDGEWRVLRSGNVKATKTFKTKVEAVEYAKSIAKNNNGSIMIHNMDGKISKGHNYKK